MLVREGGSGYVNGPSGLGAGETLAEDGPVVTPISALASF